MSFWGGGGAIESWLNSVKPPSRYTLSPPSLPPSLCPSPPHSVLSSLLPLPSGDGLVTLKEGAAAMHNRDRLMHVAFNGIGGFPMAKIVKARQAASVQVNLNCVSSGVDLC